jgi:hypothetical protein
MPSCSCFMDAMFSYFSLRRIFAVQSPCRISFPSRFSFPLFACFCLCLCVRGYRCSLFCSLLTLMRGTLWTPSQHPPPPPKKKTKKLGQFWSSVWGSSCQLWALSLGVWQSFPLAVQTTKWKFLQSLKDKSVAANIPGVESWCLIV